MLKKSNSKIFIVGVGRSGTSLIQSMLNAHPEIAFIPETHFLRRYIFTNRTWGSKSEVIKLLENDIEFQRANITVNSIIDGTHSFQELYSKFLFRYLIKKNKSIIGDKDPRNIDFLPNLFENFPESKVIHIIRDPRDVVLSRTKADWSKKWPYWMHAFMYHAQLQRGRRMGHNLLKSNYYELFYEDLLLNPEIELEKICTFSGVTYSEEMMSFSKSAKELVNDSEIQWKKETIGPLLTNNKNKWKKELSDLQIGLIQRVCENTIKELNYENESIDLNLFESSYTYFMKVLANLFLFLYPLRINLLRK